MNQKKGTFPQTIVNSQTKKVDPKSLPLTTKTVFNKVKEEDMNSHSNYQSFSEQKA